MENCLLIGAGRDVCESMVCRWQNKTSEQLRNFIATDIISDTMPAFESLEMTWDSFSKVTSVRSGVVQPNIFNFKDASC